MTDTNRPLIDTVMQGLLSLDPSAGQRAILNAMEDGYNIRTVDASNPWALQIETSVVTGVGIVEGYRSIEQRLYPANALTYDDLYRHMSDQDYITTFSTPAKSRLDLYLRKDELLQFAVNYGLNGEKRIVIPKDSIIMAGDYALSFFNQINISVSQNQGIRITWDLGEVSPLHPLASNEIRWDVVRNPEFEFIRIRIPVNQVMHTTRSTAVSASSGFSQHISFTDQYYYTRVYHWITNRWVEMVTTHTEQVYNVTQPTAVIKVFDQSLQVVIPTVYFTTGVIGSQIRVDIFTTRGDVRVAIQEYETAMFSGTFLDYDEDVNVYTTAFNNLPTKFIIAVDPLAGGANRLAFETLRELVIMNATGPQDLPITTAQLQRAAQKNGYDIVKDIDSLTNRVYLATRDIVPDTSRVDGFSPLPVTMATVKATFNELLLTDTVTLSNTADRITLLPTTLYKLINGVTHVVSNAERAAMLGYGQEQLLAILNTNNFIFSPYYYVLDTGENRFRTRIYDLDNPLIVVKNFVMTNPTTGVEVSAVNYSIEKIPTGWRLVLTTESNDLFKEIIQDDPDRFNCQLSFEPNDGGLRTFINTSVVKNVSDEVIVSDEGEYFIEFVFESQYDVTESHGLYLDGFAVSMGSGVIAPAALSQIFDIVYIVDGVQMPNQNITEIDTLINDSYLDPGAINHVGVTHDQITIKFGDHLNYLWERSRTSVAPDSYMTYAEDIPQYYTSRVYQYNGSGSIEVYYDTDSETFKNIILHYPGDPVIETPITVDDVQEILEGNSNVVVTTPVFTLSHVGNYVIIPGGALLGDGRFVSRIAEFVSDVEVVLEDPVEVTVPVDSVMIFGEVTLLHTEGDIVHGVDGQPISTLLNRDLDREFDLLMFDGAYYFATSESTLNYRNTVKNDITRWVTEDIHQLSLMLLEQTKIYFYPKQMIGDIPVYTVDNVLTRLPAKQSLFVTIFVDTDTYKNMELRVAIEQTLSEAINNEIRRPNISLDAMTDNLRAVAGTNVKSLRINNLFSGREYIVTLKDASYQFSIGKQTIGLSDGKIAVKDSITYQFAIHNTSIA